jgi:hypothetical protein
MAVQIDGLGEIGVAHEVEPPLTIG